MLALCPAPYRLPGDCPARRRVRWAGEQEEEGMRLSSHLHRKLRLLAVGALVITALAASPALAKGRTVKPAGAEKCWVSPNPLNALPYVYTVWGSGFPPGMIVNVLVENAMGTVVLLGGVGA